MNLWSRLVIRVIMGIWNVVVVVSAIILILSPQKFVFWLGFLLLLHLFTRLIYGVLASRSMVNLPLRGRINVVKCLTPKSRAILIAAYDKALMKGGNIALIKKSFRKIVFEAFNIAFERHSAAIIPADILTALSRMNDSEIAALLDISKIDRSKFGR